MLDGASEASSTVITVKSESLQESIGRKRFGERKNVEIRYSDPNRVCLPFPPAESSVQGGC